MSIPAASAARKQARSEFLRHLRRVGDLPVDAPDPETRVIEMRIGRTRRAWVKNCVAIGLSSSFVEPLESTAIFMIEMAARWLVNYLPNRDMQPALARRYNAVVEALYEEVRDFIGSHYVTSNRSDPFWLAARQPEVVSERLRERLELWRYSLPGLLDTSDSTLFNYWSYLFTLWPKGYFDGRDYPLENTISQRNWTRYGEKLAQEKAAPAGRAAGPCGPAAADPRRGAGGGGCRGTAGQRGLVGQPGLSVRLTRRPGRSGPTS